MTQKEKQLLLTDICARLPYNVVIRCTDNDTDYKCFLTTDILNELLHNIEYYDYKPYLRPMSDMTEEEKKIMRSYGFELIPYDTGYTGFANIENCIDEASFRFMEEFLNAHHFDYRGLIPMGLALEAPEGMYKTESL